MKSWSPQAHRLFCHWKAHSHPTQKLNILVSGGADSLALLTLMCELKTGLKLSFKVIHFHHGGDFAYRRQALQLVNEICNKKQLELVVFKSQKKLSKENEMRNFRREKAFEIWTKDSEQVFLTAHHQQDLLETRLLRLIRGTGPQGLTGMRFRGGAWLRPLLEFSPDELRSYLASQEQNWFEDPSNKDSEYFRNWVRHVWLKQLEVYRPGANLRLARSLELCSGAVQDLKLRKNEYGFFIERSRYLTWSLVERERWIACVLWKFKIQDYSQGQIFEIRKRLDNSKSEHTFSLSRLDWNINAKRILASLTPLL